MLSKSTQYAIRALVYIQLQNWMGKRPGVLEIARETEAPKPFTAKILHILTTQKLMESMKGRGGGFHFPEGQDEILLLKVIQVMEGDEIFYSCGFGLKHCNDQNPCPLHHDFIKVRDGLLKIVTSESIQSLAEKIRSGEAVLSRIQY